MIRRAKAQDAPALERLIRSAHARSPKYAGRMTINDKAIRQLVLGMVAQMGQSGAQASHVMVAVRDGKVVGFIAGVLDRVYHIGNELSAKDLYLINEGGTLGDTLKLVDGYIEWARGNPKVIELELSWTDALAGAERIAELYRRKGASKVGEIYELRMDAARQGDAG